MTHAPETGAENRLHFSDAGFWYVCHANLGPDSSGTRSRCRLEHCSVFKPETGVRVNDNLSPVTVYFCHLLLFPPSQVSDIQVVGYSFSTCSRRGKDICIDVLSLD